ncbi:hypothetical protein BRPE64_DCDS02540 (plasmid) [Caballeronia insecticola]|uniref:Uncharacterized protein n=1 Tax=Caballeronia insecticola TaxID=758793 RepID=R4WZM2_9BURK|nr:hypothetical protein BRPE64_DCDS02540 [Caballeronia insecticola]
MQYEHSCHKRLPAASKAVLCAFLPQPARLAGRSGAVSHRYSATQVF